MEKFTVEILECPVCHQHLEWEITAESNDQIEQAEARCSGCSAVYPVIDGNSNRFQSQCPTTRSKILSISGTG